MWRILRLSKSMHRWSVRVSRTFRRFLIRSAIKCRRNWSRLNEAACFFHIVLKSKGGADMAIVYATLIIKGVKNFADVPDRIKADVKAVLEDLDCGSLAE